MDRLLMKFTWVVATLFGVSMFVGLPQAAAQEPPPVDPAGEEATEEAEPEEVEAGDEVEEDVEDEEDEVAPAEDTPEALEVEKDPPPAATPEEGEATPTTEPAPTEPTPVEPAPMPEPAPEEVEEATSWTDDFSVFGFVDTYYNFDWNMPEQMDLNGTQGHRAYVRTQGFALSFAGLDFQYSHDNIGAIVALRFGPSAPQLIGFSGSGAESVDELGGTLGLGLSFLKQAYVTWSPVDNLTLDFGQFDTIYGAEVSESWANLNYTRGALYFLMQPFWHQGLRASYQATDTIGLTALLVNGVNEPFDADRSPDVGLQLAVTPSDAFGAWLGYYGSLEPEGKGWAHFADLVVTGSAGPVDVVFNGDLGVADRGDFDSQVYWGLSLAGRYGFSDHFGAALRGEYLSEGAIDSEAAAADIDTAFTSFADGNLVTGTLTLEYLPMDNLVIRLDNRIEASSEELFYDGDAPVAMNGDFVANSETYFSTVLGVVAKTN